MTFKFVLLACLNFSLLFGVSAFAGEDICSRALEIIPPGASPELEGVLRNFSDLSRIYRPSFGEERVRDFIVARAALNHHETQVDQAGNLTINVKGTGRFSEVKSPSIALQGHLDMVLTTKAPLTDSAVNDYFKSGVPALELKGGWIRSKDLSSTIGADNGIGVAIMMRYLDDHTIEHPPLTLLFTTAEEKGLVGAAGLVLPESIGALINIDEENFGTLANGCLGSCRIRVSDKLSAVSVPKDYYHLSVVLDGLTGGHSGVEIHKDLRNAIKLGEHFLRLLRREFPKVLVTQLDSGVLDKYNLIPNRLEIKFAVPQSDFRKVARYVEGYQRMMRERFKNKDGESMRLNVSALEPKSQPVAIDPDQVVGFLRMIKSVRIGVLSKREGFTHNMNLSSNIAFLKVEANGQKSFDVNYGIMPRAFEQNTLDRFVSEQGHDIFDYSPRAHIEFPSSSPTWVPKPSWLIDVFNQTATRIISRPFKIWSAPGGLETARFYAQHPNIPMIAIGPTIEGAHTENERVEVSSVQSIITLLDQALIDIGLSPQFGINPAK